jgi:hypothetical protein
MCAHTCVRGPTKQAAAGFRQPQPDLRLRVPGRAAGRRHAALGPRSRAARVGGGARGGRRRGLCGGLQGAAAGAAEQHHLHGCGLSVRGRGEHLPPNLRPRPHLRPQLGVAGVHLLHSQPLRGRRRAAAACQWHAALLPLPVACMAACKVGLQAAANAELPGKAPPCTTIAQRNPNHPSRPQTGAPSCLVLGTEDGRLLILNSAGGPARLRRPITTPLISLQAL